MFVVEEKSLDDLMRAVLERIPNEGRPIEPTKGRALEVVGAALELANPLARLSRSESRSTAFSAIGELLWYLSGSDSADDVSYYIKMYEDLAVDGRIEGAYGPRLRGEQDQLRSVVDVLTGKTDSRQAVVQIFDRSDLANERDVPCTTTMQFFLREGRLDLVVSMRSNDVFLGLPHDVFCFTMIQELVARSVGAKLGKYVHLVGSLHLYDRHSVSAKKFLDEGWQGSAQMPEMPDQDPWEQVDRLLELESMLRQKPGSQPTGETLDVPYWGDLAAMLWAFRASLDGGPHLDEVAASLTDDYYKVYMNDRQVKVEGR